MMSMISLRPRLSVQDPFDGRRDPESKKESLCYFSDILGRRLLPGLVWVEDLKCGYAAGKGVGHDTTH